MHGVLVITIASADTYMQVSIRPSVCTVSKQTWDGDHRERRDGEIFDEKMTKFMGSASSRQHWQKHKCRYLYALGCACVSKQTWYGDHRERRGGENFDEKMI